MNPHEVFDRSSREATAARQLLENRTFQAVIERLEAEYTTTWRYSAPDEAAERETAWHLLRALDRIKRDVEALASSDAVAAHNLRRMLKPNTK